MRVNVYAEELTDRIEIIGKEIDGHVFTGVRFYLELPVSVPSALKAIGAAILNEREKLKEHSLETPSIAPANTNRVTADAIYRCHEKMQLALPLFLSQACPGEERPAIAGALLLTAIQLRPPPDRDDRKEFLKLVSELYDAVAKDSACKGAR